MKACFVLLAVVPAFAACSSAPTDNSAPEPPVLCTLEARAGISVTVVDSLTGQAVSSAPKVRAREGAFIDSSYVFSTPSTGPYSLVYERAGTYTVTVDASGYRQWKQDNVVVTRDQCHVHNVSITAKLQK